MKRLMAALFVLVTLGLPLAEPSAATPKSLTASLNVDPSSNLVYGGEAVIDVTASGYGSDSANLYAYCTQNGTTWLIGSYGVVGYGVKGVNSPVRVLTPAPGTYQYDWVGGAATCFANLYVYTWRGQTETGAFVAATVPFNVAA